MSNEFTINGSIAYEDSEETDFSIAITDKLANITTKKYVRHKQNIGTTEEALDIGELTIAGGWAFIINRDSTNYVEIRSATGASNDIIKILAGEFALFRWGSDVSAPYAIANTSSCQIEYCFWSA
jgi:hypothetical protein